MKKSDLKNRMVVEYRNGLLRLVVGDILIGAGGSMPLSYYKENLICLDINGYLKCLWERPEIKEVTMSEVEEKFGCKVKIVKEK